jgi:hypothetical protein
VNRRRRRPATVSAALAVLTIALYTLLGGGPAPAASATANTTANGPEARAPTAPTGTGLRLSIDSMNPRVVTSTGPNTLTVTGSLTNAGEAPVRDVEIRAQLSQRLRTEGDIRTALAGNAMDDAVTPGFVKLATVLGPGAEIPVQLTVGLRGPASTSLALAHGGVYELLLNVNGTPSGGDQARLVGVRMLLPVLGLPAADGYPAEPAMAATGAAPRRVSMLYPLADRPRRLPTGPGEPVLLADDQLAGELSRGGRLDALLDALETAAPVGSPVRSAICLAVDPDLLRTAADMTGGYRVRTGNGTATVPGRGAAAAANWLNRLRADAAGHCVIALPFADADLVALSRAGLADLAGYATIEGAAITRAILGTEVRSDTTWPADGLLDERSLNDYAKAGGHTVVLTDGAVSGSGSARAFDGADDAGTAALVTPDATSTGVLTDPLVTLAATGSDGAGAFAAALGGTGERTGLGSLTGTEPLSPADKGGTLSAQDAIGTIAYRALGSPRPGPLLIAPPHRWDTTGADARSLLDSISTLITAGRLSAAALPGSGGSGAGGRTASLVYPLRAGAREVPTAVTTALRADRDVTSALRSAAIPAQGVGTTPAQVFDPVTQGLLRAASAVWRGRPSLSTDATNVITTRVSLLRSLVRVVEPPTPYALGDKEAPLPLTLSNGLPVAMRVRVLLSYTPGLQITSITPDPSHNPIPPLGRLQLRASTQLTRSGQFTVEARLAALNGAPLGPSSRLVLRSTVYGTITLWLTGTAGLLLVILAVRRIVRRLRGSVVPRPDAVPRTKAGRRRAPVARRLGAIAREQDEAAIRRGPSPNQPRPNQPDPVRPEPTWSDRPEPASHRPSGSASRPGRPAERQPSPPPPMRPDRRVPPDQHEPALSAPSLSNPGRRIGRTIPPSFPPSEATRPTPIPPPPVTRPSGNATPATNPHRPPDDQHEPGRPNPESTVPVRPPNR